MVQKEKITLKRCLDTEVDKAIGDSVGYQATLLIYNPIYDSMFNFDASIDNTLYSAARTALKSIASDEVIKTVKDIIYATSTEQNS